MVSPITTLVEIPKLIVRSFCLFSFLEARFSILDPISCSRYPASAHALDRSASLIPFDTFIQSQDVYIPFLVSSCMNDNDQNLSPPCKLRGQRSGSTTISFNSST